ncbi:hypothetical protein, partial [Mesorhizobium sp. M0208]|uniref:hypothetical protein n=1 Tax=Mesorhizobium sp. M0208 TaxID=2956916 RepID=UPI00333C08E5
EQSSFCLSFQQHGTPAMATQQAASDLARGEAPRSLLEAWRGHSVRHLRVHTVELYGGLTPSKIRRGDQGASVRADHYARVFPLAVASPTGSPMARGAVRYGDSQRFAGVIELRELQVLEQASQYAYAGNGNHELEYPVYSGDRPAAGTQFFGQRA